MLLYIFGRQVFGDENLTEKQPAGLTFSPIR